MGIAALRFLFPDESQAALAGEMLCDLGYDLRLDGGVLLHLQVRDEELISALEIVQAYSGQLIEHAPDQASELTGLAYELEKIPLLSPLVNEDWEESYLRGE